MIAAVVERYVIQDKNSGLFLAEDLSWVRSFKRAGRCDDMLAALETIQWNSCDECEVHKVVEFAKG
jgi:hypothetical protein